MKISDVMKKYSAVTTPLKVERPKEDQKPEKKVIKS